MDPELLQLPSEVKTGRQCARAEVVPATFDQERLEVDLAMGSGAEVVRAPWFEQPYIEELSMDPRHIRMERLASGKAPVLNGHRSWGLEGTIGVVRTARVEGGQLVVRARFSKREDVAPIVQDVRDGIIANTSLGYRVFKFEDVTKPADKYRRLRATDWEPLECSLVSVPADPTGGVRSVQMPMPATLHGGAKGERAAEDFTTCHIQGQRTERTMDPEELKAKERAEAAARDQKAKETAAATATAEADASRAAAQAEGAKLERERTAEVLRLAGVHKLGDAWVQRMVADPKAFGNAAAIQRAALDELATRSDSTAGNSHVTIGADAGEKISRAVRSALEVRVGLADKLIPEAVDLGRFGLRRLAEEFFSAGGIRTGHLNPTEFACLAMKGQSGGAAVRASGLMSTSDFAQLLSNVQNKRMRKAYDGTPQTWLAFASRSEAPDFKPLRRIQLSNGTGLKTVNEHGEVEHGSMSDSAENYSLTTQGIIYGLTRRAFLNDDLGEFNRMSARMGARAAERRSDLVYAMVVANPNLADGIAWFEAATHKNLITGGGSVLSLTSLTTMLGLFRRQLDLDGKAIAVAPYSLFVPPELEVLAKQLTTQVTPNISSSVNPFQGLFSNVVVEPRLTSATAWFVFANPAIIDVVEYAELAGQAGPQTMVRNGFDVDGIEWRILDDFGVAPLEYVSAFKSAGA